MIKIFKLREKEFDKDYTVVYYLFNTDECGLSSYMKEYSSYQVNVPNDKKSKYHNYYTPQKLYLEVYGYYTLYLHEFKMLKKDINNIFDIQFVTTHEMNLERSFINKFGYELRTTDNEYIIIKEYYKNLIS